MSNISETSLPGVYLMAPQLYPDERGHFYEVFHAGKLSGSPIPIKIAQVNHSRSRQHVLRGLHAQRHKPQGKIIRAIVGEIYDVAVDIRLTSPTFGQWVGVTLSDKNHHQLYVPPGFAHGFCVISETAEVEYLTTDFYDPKDEFGIRWSDPDLKITWPTSTPIVSPKDSVHPTLQELKQKHFLL